jgi:CheY-like chemotaxis protein/DNA-binding transcriptional regulator YiaG
MALSSSTGPSARRPVSPARRLHQARYPSLMLPTPELVARIRQANGDTQEGLARRLGVSFPTINAWERGRSEPKPGHRHTLEELAASLNINRELVVLVIDDDPVTGELVRAAALDVDAEVVVDVALDGWEGLVKCGTRRPHLLFLDVMMPGIDGLEVARRLPSIEGLGDVRVVFVTASQSRDVLAGAAALGNDLLAKPLELDDLARVMSTALEGARR